MVYSIKQLKELSNKSDISELDKRIIIYNYIIWAARVNVPQVITAKINDVLLFKNNVQIAKNYFNSFTDE